MNAWILRYSYLLLCVIVPLDWARAEVISGTVTDASGAGVQGAIVQLLAGGYNIAETKTGANGEFALSTPTGARTEDEYTILAAASAFAPARRSIRLAESGSRKVELVLDVAPYRQSVEIHTSIPMNESLLDLSGCGRAQPKI